MNSVPEGLALYVRQIRKNRHGTPAQLAKKFADHGASWVAIGGPWQEPDKRNRVRIRYINRPETILRYAAAFKARDVTPYVWGYPWQGHEEAFIDAMETASNGLCGALLDPELGANPTKSSKAKPKRAANAHAHKLIKLTAERFITCGVSTYGSAARFKWFPLNAFASALQVHFGPAAFLGGQTYTNDTLVSRSIRDFSRVLDKHATSVHMIPNFGTYSRTAGRVVPKKPFELYDHLGEFVDDVEPIYGLIGWAENFMTPMLWRVFARFARQLERGVCSLPGTGF